MILRCCYPNDHTKVIEYKIPPNVEINAHNSIYEDVDFYNADVKAHKKRMQSEILHSFLIFRKFGVSKDLTREFVNKYIKRPVEYGNHDVAPLPVHHASPCTIYGACYC